MNITYKMQSIKEAYRKLRKRPWFRRSIGALKHWLHTNRGWDRHHDCEAKKAASKNTRPNEFNVRASKARRPESRFMKLRAFKLRYGIK